MLAYYPISTFLVMNAYDYEVEYIQFTSRSPAHEESEING